MKIKQTFNDKLIVRTLEDEFLSVGAISTQQRKPFILVEVLGINEKSELPVSVGSKVYIDAGMPRTKVSDEEEIYVISEKALVYEGQ